MRILVVEDEATIQRLLADVLAAPGVNIDAVGTCGEALTLLGTHPYEWIVLDNTLPDGKGIDLIRTARAAGCRVVMATSDGHCPEFSKKAVQLGAERVFVKPFSIRDLARYIHGACASA